MSRVQYFNIVVTYMNEDKIQDQFLQFEPLTNTMGLGLMETLKKTLEVQCKVKHNDMIVLCDYCKV